jgi:hypothetical protein
MASFLSPGVQIEEIDRSQRFVTNNSKVAVVAIPSDVGEVNKLTYISSEAELVDKFGKPNNNNYIEWFSALSIIQYGLIVGVIRPDETTNGLYNSNATTTGALTDLSIFSYDEYLAGTNDYVFAAKTPSDLYNGLKVVTIDHGADQIVTIKYSPSSGVVDDTDRPLVGSRILVGNTPAWIYDSTEILIGTDTIPYNTLTIVLSDPTKKVKANDVIFLDSSTQLGTIQTANNYYEQQLVAPGLFWSNIAPQPGTSIHAKSTNALFDEMHVVVIDTTGKISGVPNTILETYKYLSKAIDGKNSDGISNYWKNVILSKSRYIYPGNQVLSNTITLTTDGIQEPGNINAPILNKVYKLFVNAVNKSNISYILTSGTTYNWTTPSVISGALDSAYDLVADAQTFGDIDFLIPGNISIERITKLLTICENRRDCRVAVSPPYNKVVNSNVNSVKEDEIIEFYDTLPSSSFMIFGDNYKYIYDNYNGVYRYIPTAADIAGLTLSTTHSWQSPAGITHGVLRGAIKLAYSATQAGRDKLYSHRINPIISYPGRGILLYGDKTALSSPSAFDRIGVRGLVIEVQKTISQFSENVLFEINDEATRSNFVNIVTPYLQNILVNRGVYEYKIVCDNTNNTPTTIDANIFNADIYLKPAKSINFVKLSFIITATGASFTDSTSVVSITAGNTTSGGGGGGGGAQGSA